MNAEPTGGDQKQPVTSTIVGTVELLCVRIYPLDPQTGTHPLATEVVVEPGTYPVYKEYEAYYWMMTGRINGRWATKIGDGLFFMTSGDEASGPTVTFPSNRYGPTQFSELLDEPTCTNGHPDQRLRFILNENVGGSR